MKSNALQLNELTRGADAPPQPFVHSSHSIACGQAGRTSSETSSTTGLFYGNNPEIPDLRKILKAIERGESFTIQPRIYSNASTKGYLHHKYKDVTGKRKSHTLGLREGEVDEATAKHIAYQEIERLIGAELSSGVAASSIAEHRESETTISMLFDQVIEEKKMVGRSDGHIKNLKASEAKLKKWFGDVPITSLSRQHFRKIVEKTRVVMDGYVFIRRCDYNAIKIAESVFNVAVACGLIERNPIAKLSLPKILKASRGTINLTEFWAGIEGYSPTSVQGQYIRLASIIYMHTGFRPSVLRRIKMQDIDVVRGTLNFAREVSLPVKPTGSTVVQLSQPALSAIAAMLEVRKRMIKGKETVAEDYLLLSSRCTQVSERTLSLWFKYHKEHLWPDKPSLSLYSFRHAFDTELEKAGLIPEKIALAMGKKSWRTTKDYLDSSHADHLTSVRPVLDRLKSAHQVPTV